MARICCHLITETKTEKITNIFCQLHQRPNLANFQETHGRKQQTFTVLEKNLSVQAFLWASDGNLTAGLGTFAEVQSWQVWNVVVALAADLKSG